MRSLATAAWLFWLGTAPAWAGPLTDWNLSPASADVDGWTATLGGSLSGAGYASSLGGQGEHAGMTGSLLFLPRMTHQFDNGWEFGAHAALLAWHDELSGDAYGNRFFEKAYLSLDTQYGRFEAGEQDGAAYGMAITGPRVDESAGLDDATVTFWRNPATGEAFTDIFRVRSGEFATANFAKFSYTSPRLFGVQLGASYTPAETHGGLPFLQRSGEIPGRQSSMFEGAANYTGEFGPASFGLYAGGAIGQMPMPGESGLRDWGFGGEFDYDLEGTKLAVGGAWRSSNAYTFIIDSAFASGATRAARLSTTVTNGPWIFGFEYSDGRAGREASLPGLHLTGYEPSIAYVVNSNLQLTLGWQSLRFTRDPGTFVNGAPDIAMQAAFLHAALHV